jgi:hypothetical protein
MASEPIKTQTAFFRFRRNVNASKKGAKNTADKPTAVGKKGDSKIPPRASQTRYPVPGKASRKASSGILIKKINAARRGSVKATNEALTKMIPKAASPAIWQTIMASRFVS